MSKLMIAVIAIFVLLLAGCGAKIAKSATGKMTPEKLAGLIAKFDETAKAEANSVAFKLRDRDIILVYDVKADRMRVVTPVAQAALADEDILIRMLQANYDAVLDSRYAIANNAIWAVFVHPLSSLAEEDFLSGIAQVVTAAETFGSSYTSGAFVFGGGDSNTIHEDLLKELEKAVGEKNGRDI